MVLPNKPLKFLYVEVLAISCSMKQNIMLLFKYLLYDIHVQHGKVRVKKAYIPIMSPERMPAYGSSPVQSSHIKIPKE